MAEKTKEEEDALIAQSIHEQIARLNQTIQAASIGGIKTEIDVNKLTRIGSAPITILSAEVSRVFTPTKLPDAVPQEGGNG